MKLRFVAVEITFREASYYVSFSQQHKRRVDGAHWAVGAPVGDSLSIFLGAKIRWLYYTTMEISVFLILGFFAKKFAKDNVWILWIVNRG